MNHQEGLKTIVCPACQREKEVKYFYKNNQNYNGYQPRCKICQQTKKRINPNRPDKPMSSVRALCLSRIDKNDFIDAYDFLKKSGYDLERNIHIQFCEKYGLIPKERTKEKSLYFSPKDLGIV